MGQATVLSRLGGIVLLAMSAAGGSACVMSSLPPRDIGCTVESAELLADSVGGAAGVCAEIVRSLAAALPRPERVEVTVLSSSRARARVMTADGKALPEMTVGSSDRALARSSFRRLGDGLADQLKRLKTD